MAMILSAAAALPQLRLPASAIRSMWGQAPSGLKRKAVCAYDEDAVTLAVAAGRSALTRAEATGFDALFLGATTLPYEEKPSSATVLTALTSRRTVPVYELRGSPQAGLQALELACDWVAARPGSTALAIAADAPEGHPDQPVEHPLGAGAAAFLIGSTEGGIARLGTPTSVTVETFGARFRRRGSPVLQDLELRTRPLDTAIGLLKEAGALAAAQHLATGLPARTAAGLAKATGADADDLFASLGDIGAAAAPVALVDALDRAVAGSRILAVATGAGAMALPVTVLTPAGTTVTVAQQAAGGVEIDYPRYLRERRLLSHQFAHQA